MQELTVKLMLQIGSGGERSFAFVGVQERKPYRHLGV